jgi:hypothetical protein
MPPLTGSPWCFTHSPERGAARAQARTRGGQSRRTPVAMEPPDQPPQLRDVPGIQIQLERAFLDTLLQSNGAQRSRTLGYLLGIALRIVEVGELEARIAAIEQRFRDLEPRRVA